MNKKLIAWLLIIPGGALVAVYMVLNIMGRLEMKIEIENENFLNFYREYGVGTLLGMFVAGIIMIVIGRMILKKEKTLKIEETEEHELKPGESIVFKQSGSTSLVIVTNQRVRYYGFMTKDLGNTYTNLPASDREDYEHNFIKSVRAVSNGDLLKSRLGRKAKFGVQLELKDGRIVNMPVASQDDVALRIGNAMKMAEVYGVRV